MLLGMTGTGKSTLSVELLHRWLREHPAGRALIIDSKPRFRATHTLAGNEQVYRNWVQGDIISNSIGITRVEALGPLWRLTRVVIYQSVNSGGHLVEGYEDGAARLAQDLFRSSTPRRPTLLVIDEYYDLLTGGLAALLDRRLLKTIRAGREKGMAVMAGAQRPRSIPLPTLTESTKFGIFHLEYEEDVKYLRKHGPQLTLVPTDHQFVWFERQGGGKSRETLCELNLRKRAS